MGVIYKLTPNVREYILKQRFSDPSLGCRKIVSLVLDKFQVKVSKSSVNSIIKASGVSMPIGRRGRRSKISYSGAGVIFLKAMDSLVGGSQGVIETINKNKGHGIIDIDNKTRALLFSSLNFDPSLKLIFGWGFTNEELSIYLADLQKIENLNQEMSNLIAGVFQEIKCFKIELKDGNCVFIDSQRHNIWATDKIPGIFFTTIYEANGYINRYLNTSEPFVFLQATGYDKPAPAFFNCVLSMADSNAISKITLLDNNLKETPSLPLPTSLDVTSFVGARGREDQMIPFLCGERGKGEGKKHSLLFGLWPWQFTDYRKIKIFDEFRPFISEALKDKLYIAEAEFELSQPIDNKSVTLRGAAVKSMPEGPIRLFILTNSNEISSEKAARIYFNHWPNLEEAFKDFSNKIELYSKTSHATDGNFVVAELARQITTDQGQQLQSVTEGNNIDKIFQSYLTALDLYFRRYFLPPTCENRDFPTMKRDFYDLKATVKRQKNNMMVTFKPPAGYLCLKELKYACNRINERFILMPDGKRLIFSLSH